MQQYIRKCRLYIFILGQIFIRNVQKNKKVVILFSICTFFVLKYMKVNLAGETMDFEQENTISKLKLLFVLDKMEIPLTENNIIDICTSSNNWFTYLDLKEALIELLDVKFICEEKIEGEETRYTITFDGRNCLSHFYYRIPQDMRERITAYVQDNRMNWKRSQEYVSEYTKNTDGTYSVMLKIKEPILTRSLLEIKLKAPTRQSAVEASKRWTEKAPAIYETIYDNLLDN